MVFINQQEVDSDEDVFDEAKLQDSDRPHETHGLMTRTSECIGMNTSSSSSYSSVSITYIPYHLEVYLEWLTWQFNCNHIIKNLLIVK